MYRGDFLAALINEHQFTRGAELGLWKGRTFFHLLDRCPSLVEYIGVDQWKHCPERKKFPGGQTYAAWNMRGLEAHVRGGAKKYGSRARIIKASTTEAAKQIDDGSLDFCFIDADHSLDGTRGDIVAWKPKIRSGGFLCGHDIVGWPTVKQAVEELLPGYSQNSTTDSDACWYIQL